MQHEANKTRDLPKGSTMPFPIQITERDVSVPIELKDIIKEKAENLSRYFDRIISCRVSVEAPHRHQSKGQNYSVHIDLSVPGSELVVRRIEDPDLNVAVRDAFDAARRVLEDYARKLRGDVKHHRPASKEPAVTEVE